MEIEKKKVLITEPIDDKGIELLKDSRLFLCMELEWIVLM